MAQSSVHCREIIISRAMSGGRREIELNSGSLTSILRGLATLAVIDIEKLSKLEITVCKKTLRLLN